SHHSKRSTLKWKRRNPNALSVRTSQLGSGYGARARSASKAVPPLACAAGSLHRRLPYEGRGTERGRIRRRATHGDNEDGLDTARGKTAADGLVKPGDDGGAPAAYS